MDDLELDFDIAGEGALDDWRVETGVVSLFLALRGVPAIAGVLPRIAAADAACALAQV
jgi:hypothetical protein